MVRIPQYVREALEAGCDIIEFPDGHDYVFHGFRSGRAFKTSTAAAKAACEFMETRKAAKRAANLAAFRSRNA